MIEIRIESKNENIMSFRINNHALIGREAILAGDAYDMVCNSVSVLSQSVVIGLDEMFGSKKRREYITLIKEEV